MDRRTQLAIALVALILGGNLLYTARFQKRNMEEPRARARPGVLRDTTALAPAPAASLRPEPPAVAPAPLGSGPFPAATAGEGDLVVDTPLQRIRITRSGGLVREIVLHKFHVSSTASPVDLVPQQFAGEPGRSGLGLVLQGQGAQWDLSAAGFDPAPGDFPPDGRLVLAAGSGPRTIALRCAAAGGGAVVKRLTFDPDRYDFQLDLQLERGPGLPPIDSYTLDWTTGMPSTEWSAREDEMRFRVVTAVDQQMVRKKAVDFRKQGSASAAGTIRWACVQSKYFTVGLIPATAQAGTVELLGDAKSFWIGLRLTQPTPWRTGTDSYRVYAGPIDLDSIRALGVGMEATVELGWRWIRPISGVLLGFMKFLNRFIPNYGLIILIVSVLAKLMFWPLTERSIRSMRRMQDLQPRMAEIRRRYKDDPKAMNEQVMHLYREQKVNPVGGCMPMLVQTPMFFALFSVLQSDVQLRNAPFVGWIDNLAGPDILYHLPASLPVIGQNVSLLPLLMGGSMLWQSAIGSTMTPPGAGGSGPMAQQQFIMKWLMPIMMTFFFYKMPSGLVLYWTVNTLMGIAQQVQINRKFGPAAVAAAPAGKIEGRAADGRADRGDGAERGGSPSERPDRVGRRSR